MEIYVTDNFSSKMRFPFFSDIALYKWEIAVQLPTDMAQCPRRTDSSIALL
jgi:hypothetical protein